MAASVDVVVLVGSLRKQWTGFQSAKVKIQGRSDPMDMKLRITELFRRIDGDWKLVHRHADPMADKQER
jgi:ketosteroid isomerase-like protein